VSQTHHLGPINQTEAQRGCLRPIIRPLRSASQTHGQEEECRRAREAGFDWHVTKPVDPVYHETLLANRAPA